MAFDWNELREKLPEIRAEYDRLGRLLAILEGTETLADLETDPPANEENGRIAPVAKKRPSGGTTTIGRDDFVGLSTAEAIKAFLAKMGRGNPQGPRAMARAMIEGGRGDSDEEKAYVNVVSSLKRLKKNKEVRQVRRGEWGLSSWYNQGPEA